MSAHATEFWNFICNSLDNHTIDVNWYASAVLYYRKGYYHTKLLQMGEAILSLTPEERITLDLIVYNSISE